MEYSCQPGSGHADHRDARGVLGVRSRRRTRAADPGRQCVHAHRAARQPCRHSIDPAWSWGDPTFTVDGVPAPSGRSRTRVRGPDAAGRRPEPNVGIVVTNTVNRAFGSFTVAKSSDPPTGSIVQPGGVHQLFGHCRVDRALCRSTTSSSATICPGSCQRNDRRWLDRRARRDRRSGRRRSAGARVDGRNVGPRDVAHAHVPGPGQRRCTGVTIGNVVSATADVPPTTCPPGARKRPSMFHEPSDRAGSSGRSRRGQDRRPNSHSGRPGEHRTDPPHLHGHGHQPRGRYCRGRHDQRHAPARRHAVSATPTQGSCQIQGLTIQCALGAIAPGAAVQVTVAVNVPPTPTGGNASSTS